MIHGEGRIPNKAMKRLIIPTLQTRECDSIKGVRIDAKNYIKSYLHTVVGFANCAILTLVNEIFLAIIQPT